MDAQPPSTRRQWPFLVAVASVAVAVVVLVVFFVLDRDGAEDVRVEPADTTTTETTAAPTTETTEAAVDTTSALYPDTTMSKRFSDPVEAARSFATEYLGMTDPEVGEYMAGEPRAGEVAVRAKPGRGPITTVVVRQLGPDEQAPWFVTAAASANLQLDTPDPLQVIESPVLLEGRSRSFEATVSVGVREDGQLGKSFLGEGFYTGGSAGPDLGPFRHRQEFREPTREWGAVLLLVYSAEDGNLAEATVVRVRFPPRD